MRGQYYDGAASMRGSYKGVQSRIRSENKLAIYVHCYAYVLNLCLVDLSKQLSFVRNTLGHYKLYIHLCVHHQREIMFLKINYQQVL